MADFTKKELAEAERLKMLPEDYRRYEAGQAMMRRAAEARRSAPPK